MSRQRHLEDTVGRLGEESYGQQTTEVPKAQKNAQITHDGHAIKSHIR
ncbi:hypothetical protein GCM10015535_17960 [Streptomyces gelaticus]|uniref:Uncharacterized protein n=1 Tax=Streptomyces gelaticus TaxID=285446 RepID=A0ABQ2VUQ2_9ACTN|nr:hypothetical protein GCM10015535_17960 [Streptomyces gelaticus]